MMKILQLSLLHVREPRSSSVLLVRRRLVYKQVQIYDIRTSATTRRPVLYTPEGNLFEHRITSLCQLHDNNTLAIGDSIGDCHLIDMRKMHSGKQYSARKQHAKEEIGLGRLVGP